MNDNFEALWTSYPSDLCRKKRGSKLLAKKAFDKINPLEDEFKRIMGNMRAQIKADRMDKDSYRWPFVSSYLNQARYDDFIMPSKEASTEELTVCSVDSCNERVHGRSFKFCAFHIPSAHSEAIKQAWIRTGIDYKSKTLTEDCRKHCRERMNVLLGRTA